MTREGGGKGSRARHLAGVLHAVSFLDDRVAGEHIRSLARERGIELLLGSDQVDHAARRYYNSAFLVRRDGTIGGIYQKMHLVPFGEFVPLRRSVVFVGPLVERAGGFTPGADMVMLPTARGPISTAICYEIVFPR
jgi:apolipoprotein N-acyltransferase